MIRVNWHQKGSGDGRVRYHEIMDPQPKGCQFDGMKGKFEIFPDEKSAKAAIKARGCEDKPCEHCLG